MRLKIFAISIILVFVFSLLPPTQQVSAASFEVNYTLTLEQEDRPEVTIKVQGYPNQNAVFLGPAGDHLPPLETIFQEIEVIDLTGSNLAWQWIDKGISVNNGNVQDFTIRYNIDAINYQPKQSNHSSEEKIVLFRFRRIFFIAGDVFLTPKLEPENISVDYSLPEGTTLYASLPSEGGAFHAVRDLWGNLLTDFSIAYFAGGHALFTLNHTTDWGDDYQYIWFDRDPLLASWTPFYGNTPWEQAELYMENAESCAGYFRDEIGPLPTHRVLFTNIIHPYEGFPSAGTYQDWYHYMQIWPRYSEPGICHHVFHQYSFGEPKQSKLVFGGDSIGMMLDEGLPTFYEQVLPSQLFGDPRYSGKLFEFFVLDTRGMPFGIRGNTDTHVQYNLSALKVYLLDQYIRSVTDGAESLDGFVKAMWEMVKDNSAPEIISQGDILSAFSSLVGAENAGYLNRVVTMSTFNLQEMDDLRSPFTAYSDWMIKEYFWSKPILFYMYLDITAAKGNEWPHFATYPHNIPRYRRDALLPVWDYLSSNSDSPITQIVVLDAMNAATRQNHADFFEFWESLGVTLDPNEIAELASWNPKNPSLEDPLPLDWWIAGNLQTEHMLGGIAQKATIHLDTPSPTNQIYIEYQYIKGDAYMSSAKVKKTFQGGNVSVISSYIDTYGDFYSTAVVFQIKTDDPNNQDFPITLTYPLGEGTSRFAVAFEEHGNQLGELYYLGPIVPIPFDLVIKDNVALFPDTPLEGETFIVSSEGATEQYKPGDTFQLPLTSGPFEVRLLDKYGFVRGLSNSVPGNLPLTADFDFEPSDSTSRLAMQFNDASSDPDGQIQSWLWDFGDGQMSIENNPQHTYAKAGSYSVSLTITDEEFGTDTIEKQILVGREQQSANQKKGAIPGLLLIGGGILLGCGLVLVLLHSQKKRRETQKE